MPMIHIQEFNLRNIPGLEIHIYYFGQVTVDIYTTHAEYVP